MSLPLTEEEREEERYFGALDMDDCGRETLIGLTHEQSRWLIQFRRDTDPCSLRKRPASDHDKGEMLAETHERALRAVLLAMIHRGDNPPH